MARQPIYFLIFLMPSPRLELRTLAGYRMVTVQIAVAASCHVAVSLLVTSAHRQMQWAEGLLGPSALDNVPSAGALLRVRLISPVGAVRPLRHTPFHSPVLYKLTASLQVSRSICCAVALLSAVHTDATCGASVRNSRAQHITGNMWRGVRSI